MKKYFFDKLLFVLTMLFFSTSCTNIFDDFLVDDQEGPEIPPFIEPQPYIDKLYTKEQQDKANTAKDAAYLSDKEKYMIFLCNLARLDGQKYVDLLDIRTATYEYAASLRETLDTVKDYPMLYPNERLCEAAAFHADDMKSHGIFQHSSSDGTNFYARLKRFYDGYVMSENIHRGPQNPSLIVRTLLIDDGVPSVGHRENILSPKFTRIGVAIHFSTSSEYYCVQDFSDDAGDEK